MDLRDLRLLSLFLILLSTPFIASADPHPLQDFCVGDLPSALHANGLFCKDPSLVQSTDFVFTGFRHPGNTSATGFAGTLASVLQFPGLNSLGISLARADFAPGGVNVPHYHPRATDIAIVAEGTIYSGFVTTENKVFTQILHKGDVMVFPRGLVHFQLNVGKVPAVMFGAFDSQNPGLNRLPTTLFGSGIKDEVLEKAFQMSAKEVENLKAKLTPKH